MASKDGNTTGRWLRRITQNKVRDHFRRLGHEVRGVGGSSAQERLAQVPTPQPAEESGTSEEGERGLLALRMADHFLDVVRRPAGCGVGPAAVAEGVDTDGHPGRGGGFIDRPVPPLPQRLIRLAQKEDLAEVRIVGAELDLLYRGDGVLVRDDH